jgi:branched-chain amino acid transport system ATP-binding protein
MTALHVNDLHVRINQAHILQGVSFTVPKHKVTALMGRNGVGKSTTLKAIMGLYKGTGSITFNGVELIGKETFEIASSGIAYIPEDREIFTTLTVKENLELAARKSTKQNAYEQIYALFPELQSRSAQRAGSLSGGQQQMVSIARVLLNENEIILVDEPTKGLAPKLVTEVADALAKVAKNETMIIVEQNLGLVKRVAEHLLVMDQGRIIYEGSPEKLSDPEWVHAMLGVSGGGAH